MSGSRFCFCFCFVWTQNPTFQWQMAFYYAAAAAPSLHICSSLLPRFNFLSISRTINNTSKLLISSSLPSCKSPTFLNWQILQQNNVQTDRAFCYCKDKTDESKGSQPSKALLRSVFELGSKENLLLGVSEKESNCLNVTCDANQVVHSYDRCENLETAEFNFTTNTQASEVSEEETYCGFMEEGSSQTTWKIQRFPAQASNPHAVVEDVQGLRGPPCFPYKDNFILNDIKHLSSSVILEILDPFLADTRKQRIEKVVANRTYSILPVVEGLDDLGNISAVFRSAEALGFQSVHVISKNTKKRYKKNRKVSVGAEKWLDVEIWDTTKKCIDALRARGYRIASTNISDSTVSILEMDWTVPTAVIFGNELRGISDEALALSDMGCSIPMIGMVDSFNVSVAAGILMYHAVHDRISRTGKHGDLSLAEQRILTADFYLRHKSHSISVLDHLVAKRESSQQALLVPV